LAKPDAHPWLGHLPTFGGLGRVPPARYGHVQEKTIWSYWYEPHTCPSSKRCALPAHIELCIESVRRNRGAFDYRLLHRDEVHEYVDELELPSFWPHLTPQLQKDSLMNALLARYGGVAIDASVLLLRPLEDYWDEMVRAGATYRGYYYRLSGRPWRAPASSLVWFLMSRREGVFRIAAARQAMSKPTTAAMARLLPRSTFADEILTPVLRMFNGSLPKCGDDGAVADPRSCPECRAASCGATTPGPARNDYKLLLEDPRDGPVLPFMLGGNASDEVALWSVADGSQAADGRLCAEGACCSPGECWRRVFLPRYRQLPGPGRARPLSFLKVSDARGGVLANMSRRELLARNDSFFCNWLRLAGLEFARPPL